MERIDPARLFEEGCALHDVGDYERALVCFDEVVALAPAFAAGHLNRGVALQGLGRWQDSVMSLSQALAIDPGLPAAWSGLGVAMNELRHFVEAVECLQKAVALAPEHAPAHNNLGACLRDLRRLDEAIACLRKALEIQPAYPQAANNLALALRDAGRFEESVEAFRTAVAQDRRSASIWSNLGVTLGMVGRAEEALECIEQALRLRPDDPELVSNRARALLAAGRLPEGWRAFESRWTSPSSGLSLPFPAERQWDGTADPRGKTILVHHEQGLGDSLQFCRYIPLLAARGARVVVQAPYPLVRLFSGLEGVARVVDREGAVPLYDWHCPMMSLPACFGTALGSIPAQVPYLRPVAGDAVRWSARLGPHTRPRVGLVWSGGVRPGMPELHATNERRNMSFTTLARLNLPGVDFFSLQKGEPALGELRSQRARHWSGANLLDFVDELVDFADTAALVDNLDLVVSVDTSTAHLAGAMGKPVWILNRYDMCWRWRLAVDGSPWYPSARLFNQDQPNDWSDVVDRVALALRAWAAHWEPSPAH